MADWLLDTSAIIAIDERLPPHPPQGAAVSTMTLAELHVGVLTAPDALRPRRVALMAIAERSFEALPIDASVALHYGRLVAAARRSGRRLKTADGLIAATAIAHGLPLYTLDEDFRDLPGLAVVGL